MIVRFKATKRIESRYTSFLHICELKIPFEAKRSLFREENGQVSFSFFLSRRRSHVFLAHLKISTESRLSHRRKILNYTLARWSAIENVSSAWDKKLQRRASGMEVAGKERVNYIQTFFKSTARIYLPCLSAFRGMNHILFAHHLKLFPGFQVVLPTRTCYAMLRKRGGMDLPQSPLAILLTSLLDRVYVNKETRRRAAYILEVNFQSTDEHASPSEAIGYDILRQFKLLAIEPNDNFGSYCAC